MKANYKKAKMEGNVSMSLYEINQNIMSQMPAYTDDQKAELIDKLNSFAQKHPTTEFFMFLCREAYYYTLLRKQSSEPEFSTFGDCAVTLISEWGKEIVAADDFEDRYEFWLKDTDTNKKETNCFLLFPYDQGVVTFGNA